MDIREINEKIQQESAFIELLNMELGKTIVGQKQMLERLHRGGGDRFSFSTRWRGYYHARNHMMILKEYFTFKLLISYFIRQSKYLITSRKAPDRWDRIRLRILGIYHGMIGKMGKTIDPENYPYK